MRSGCVYRYGCFQKHSVVTNLKNQAEGGHDTHSDTIYLVASADGGKGIGLKRLAGDFHQICNDTFLKNNSQENLKIQ